MKPLIIHMQWQFRRIARHIGLAGILGFTLLAISGVIYCTLVLQGQKMLFANRQALHEQAHLLATNLQKTQVPQQTEAELLANFYRQFPAGSTLPDWLKVIDSAAHQQHLALDIGDYKLSSEKKGRVIRYEVQFPVMGEYVQIRQFISNVLKQIPTAALNDISIKRETVEAKTVEAQVVFVLFLKGDSWR